MDASQPPTGSVPEHWDWPKDWQQLDIEDLRARFKDMVVPVTPTYQVKEGHYQIDDNTWVDGTWVRFESLNTNLFALHSLVLDHFGTDREELIAKCDAVVEAGYLVCDGELHFDYCDGRQHAHHLTWCIHFLFMESFQPWSPREAK